MKTPKFVESAKSAVHAIAEIKAAVEAFDRGDANAFDVLEAVRVVVAAREVVDRSRPSRPRHAA